MSDVKEIIEYNLEQIDTLFKEECFEELAEFLGTSICDGHCKVYDTSYCMSLCSLYSAYYKLYHEPILDNLNELKSLVCQKINTKED